MTPRVGKGWLVGLLRGLLLALVTAAAVVSWTRLEGPRAPTAEASGSLFVCPMHPEVRSPTMGECPICHMRLEPVADERLGEVSPAKAADGSHASGTHVSTSMGREVPTEGTPTASGSSPPAAPDGVTALDLSEARRELAGIATSEATREIVAETLRLPGVVVVPDDARAEVRVRAPGFVDRVEVATLGERVRKGQVLAWVFSPEVYRAEEEFLAAERYATSGAASGQASVSDLVQAARRGLELLGLGDEDIAAISKSKVPMRAIPVRAPRNGHIFAFNAVLGTRAEPSTPLYEVADLSKVWVVASVHERDLSKVTTGAAVTFAAEGSEQALAGRVEQVAPWVDEATRSARVRITVRNPTLALRPGQIGTVAWGLAPETLVLVPRDAVLDAGRGEYVYVEVAPGRYEPRSVKSGGLHDGRVAIRSGVSAGERVVSRGGFVLDSESRLRASLQRAAPGSR